MKKFIVSLATLSLTALLFTACNSGGTTTETKVPATPEATTTVTPDAKAPATDAKATDAKAPAATTPATTTTTK